MDGLPEGRSWEQRIRISSQDPVRCVQFIPTRKANGPPMTKARDSHGSTLLLSLHQLAG
jgi:hypothetical protein